MMIANVTPRRRQSRPTWVRGPGLTMCVGLMILQAIASRSVESESAVGRTGVKPASLKEPSRERLHPPRDAAHGLSRGAPAVYEASDSTLVARGLALTRNPLGSVAVGFLKSSAARSMTPAGSPLPTRAVPGRLRC